MENLILTADLSVLPAAVESSVRMAELLISGQHLQKTAVYLAESTMLFRAIRMCCGNRNKAARILGIPTGLLEFQLQNHALEQKMNEVERIAERQFEMFNKPVASTTAQSLSTVFTQVLQEAAAGD